VFKGGSRPLTDFILEISILEQRALNELSGKALVRPFKIRLSGIRGGLIAATQSGRVSLQGVLRRDWNASAGSGSIDIATESSVPFTLDASRGSVSTGHIAPHSLLVTADETRSRQ
jgi:hypothetical protein